MLSSPFMQNLPNLMFDPRAGMLGVTSTARRFTDVARDANASPFGSVAAHANVSKAGVVRSFAQRPRAP
jgi:hypothetical protein